MEITVVATGLGFPEGPAICPSGQLHWTEIAGQRIARLEADGSVSTFAETGGGPNGCAFGPDDHLYVCNNGGSWPKVPSTEGRGPRPNGPGTIQRISRQGEVETVLAEVEGQPLVAPNDCCFDEHGGMYFTDPHWNGDPAAVRYLAADGTASTVCRGVRFPNGLAVTDDGRFLIVAESMTGRLLSWKIDGPGRVAGGVEAEPKSNGSIGRRSVPDGFCLDSAGRMIVAGHGTDCLFVLDAADGRPRFVVDLPEQGPTNCCFGGDDLRTLYVTSSDVGNLLAIEWDVPGMPLHPAR